MTSTTLSSALAQETAASTFARRRDLLRRIVKESRFRTNRVRQTVGYYRLPDEDVKSYAVSALGYGFYRALIEKFSVEKRLSSDWWTEQRRAHAKNGKDKSADLKIVLDNYPEFASYYVELTDNEVVEAAKIEFYDMIAGVGTDYHQQEAQRKNGTTSGDVVMLSRTERGGFGAVSIPDAKAVVLDAEAGDIDFVDPTAQDKVENVVLYELMNDDNDVLGPIITRIASIAFDHFEEAGLFWLVERMFLPTRFTEVLRAIGGNEEELGKTEFERIKKDMSRKLPVISEKMKELLADDPDMDKLRDSLWCKEDDCSGTRTGRLPTTLNVANTPKSDVQTEKQKSVARNAVKLLARLEEEEGESELTLYVGSKTPEELASIIPDYLKAKDDSSLWSAFKRKLAKQMEKAA
jgi:hypothetical protein